MFYNLPMKITPQSIYKKFDGKLVGSRLMKKYVCLTTAKMPKHVIQFVTKYCWFFGSLENAWAYAFTGDDLAGQHLIFLGDELFKQKPRQIYYTIAHEIGHIILKHRNSTKTKQSKAEIFLQEKEADIFAKSYV